MFSKLAAEFIGTFWLVFAGCGAALLAAGVPVVGIGIAGTALAFGLALAGMGYALGPVSGGHFNPAVSLAAWVAGRLDWRDLAGYWLVQIIGGIAGAAALATIAAGAPDFTPGGFAANGYGLLSPGGYGLPAVLLAELVLTAGFVLVTLAASVGPFAAATAPLASGLCFALVYLVAIPIDNGSANPARAIAAALFAHTGALGQLWAFLLAPLAGALIGGLVWRLVLKPPAPPPDLEAFR